MSNGRLANLTRPDGRQNLIYLFSVITENFSKTIKATIEELNLLQSNFISRSLLPCVVFFFFSNFIGMGLRSWVLRAGEAPLLLRVFIVRQKTFQLSMK